MKGLRKKAYVSPRIILSYVAMESDFSAGSVVVVRVGNNGTPDVTDWQERETDQTWNF